MNIKTILKTVDGYSDYMVWLIAVAGMFGSLYFSEVMKLAPCTLCWYQRILLYPFVAIYAVGILRKDRAVVYYGLPLAIIGAVMAFYHSLLQWGVVHESSVTCSVNSAVSCAKVQINWLGFINIPFMSFMAFLLIVILAALRIYIIKRQNSKES